MEDRIIKGNRQDRLIKCNIGNDITDFESLKTLLQNGIPADMFYNDEGAVQLGTPINKSTLLKDDTANKLQLVGENATVNGALNALADMKQTKTTARNSFVKADNNGLIIPTTLNKNDVGLSRVDNTRDADKPISNHTRNEINNIRNSLQGQINTLKTRSDNYEKSKFSVSGNAVNDDILLCIYKNNTWYNLGKNVINYDAGGTYYNIRGEGKQVTYDFKLRFNVPESYWRYNNYPLGIYNQMWGKFSKQFQAGQCVGQLRVVENITRTNNISLFCLAGTNYRWIEFKKNGVSDYNRQSGLHMQDLHANGWYTVIGNITTSVR